MSLLSFFHTLNSSGEDRKRKFVNWVDETLNLRQGSKIESFKVKYPLDKGDNFCIDRWIEYAINKEVDTLEHDFYPCHLPKNNVLHYCLPWLFNEQGKPSSIKHLSLSCCRFWSPLEFWSLKNLERLFLKDIFINEQTLEEICSACSSLEYLSLQRCVHSRTLTISSSSLKHLTLSRNTLLEEVEIFAVNLVSLEIRGVLVRVRFLTAPVCVRLVIRTLQDDTLSGIKYALGELATDFPLLQNLFLTNPPFAAKDILPKKLPAFSKLKNLIIAMTEGKLGSLLLYIPMLEAAPLLERFELQLGFDDAYDGPLSESKTSKCPKLKYLKEGMMYGFYGHGAEIEMASHLLRNAPCLKKMELNSRQKYYAGDGKYILDDGREMI
ncbi:hypothetical protein Tsubulata_032306 [Turnera subulata]|uniref:At1g61320/AtMIF1 LRR domain-containing protein n=1 Tax=Turnera subulata TaxID=218843 RepID=A0A9Q0FUE2_9ROSI|nr:hypothetical protein Tsubulata_032306 [Turnera subulata]